MISDEMYHCLKSLCICRVHRPCRCCHHMIGAFAKGGSRTTTGMATSRTEHLTKNGLVVDPSLRKQSTLIKDEILAPMRMTWNSHATALGHLKLKLAASELNCK